MSEPILPVPLGKGIPFNSWLGMFHQNWSAIDLHTDFAIYKFLKVTPQQAHLITSGMMFGRKARLLADLVRHSDADNKTEILGPFAIIQASKRDIISHSYVSSDAVSVTFMERAISGKFTAKEHRFELDEFRLHVKKITKAAEAFIAAIGARPEEIDHFAQAAFSLNRKSDTSPDSPTSSK